MYAKNRIVSTLEIVDYIKLKEEDKQRGREKRERERQGRRGWEKA